MSHILYTVCVTIVTYLCSVTSNALYLQLYVMQYAFEMKEKVKHCYLDQVLVNSLVTINRLCEEFIVSDCHNGGWEGYF